MTPSHFSGIFRRLYILTPRQLHIKQLNRNQFCPIMSIAYNKNRYPPYLCHLIVILDWEKNSCVIISLTTLANRYFNLYTVMHTVYPALQGHHSSVNTDSRKVWTSISKQLSNCIGSVWPLLPTHLTLGIYCALPPNNLKNIKRLRELRPCACICVR